MPYLWASKLQGPIALSTTEAEYISLSESLRDLKPLIGLIKEMFNKGFPVLTDSPDVQFTAFEDNSGAFEIAHLPKMRPRTKHLNIALHRFREMV